MILGHLGFGVLCAVTAALHIHTTGGPFVLVLFAYSVGGMAGLFLSASLANDQAS